MTFEAFLARLRGVQRAGTGARAFCPAHDDREKRSLSVSAGRDARILLKCFVGCAPEAIVAALGLTLADLFPDGDRGADDARPEAARGLGAQTAYRATPGGQDCIPPVGEGSTTGLAGTAAFPSPEPLPVGARA